MTVDSLAAGALPVAPLQFSGDFLQWAVVFFVLAISPPPSARAASPG